MNLRPLVVLALVVLLLATGCATVTFKPGAGPGGAKADEDACRATTASQAAYVACLRERGWMVGGKAVEPGPRKTAAPSAATSSDPQPSAAPSKPPTAAPSAPAGAPAPSKAMTPPAEGPGRAPSGDGDTPEPAKPAPPAARAGYPDAEEAAEEAPLDPDTKINVSSWWKLGGTSADLDRAVAACVNELGASHKPNPAITEVTVALKDCLRAKKWMAVGGTGPL